MEINQPISLLEPRRKKTGSSAAGRDLGRICEKVSSLIATQYVHFLINKACKGKLSHTFCHMNNSTHTPNITSIWLDLRCSDRCPAPLPQHPGFSKLMYAFYKHNLWRISPWVWSDLAEIKVMIKLLSSIWKHKRTQHKAESFTTLNVQCSVLTRNCTTELFTAVLRRLLSEFQKSSQIL